MPLVIDQTPVQPPSNAGLQPEPFARLLSHVLAYKTLLMVAALLGLFLTGLALCFVAPRYDAEGVVIVDSRRNKLADAESALSSIIIDQNQSALKSELELIRSPDLARYVITALNLLKTPEYQTALTHVPTAQRFAALRLRILSAISRVADWIGLSKELEAARDPDLPDPTSSAGINPDGIEPATVDGLPEHPVAIKPTMQNAIKIFNKRFQAENDPKSLTIRMRYRSSSPRLAAAVTNAAISKYLAEDEEVKVAAVVRSESWLVGRIASLRTDLYAAEQAVETFRAEHNLVSRSDQSPLQQQLLQLKSRQVDAQATLSAIEAKVQQNTRASASETLAAGIDVLSSRTIQELRQQEASLMTEQANLRVTLLPGHPRLVQIGDRLSKLRAAIHDEVDRIAESNDAELRLASARVADLAIQVDEVQSRINKANAADIKLRSLEADAAAKRTILNGFVQRYDQDAGPPLTTPDSRVVSWASPPVDPSSPPYGLALVGGMLGFTFLALMLSLGVERMRNGFDGVDELEEELGLQVVGLTPELPRSAASRRAMMSAGGPPAMRELSLTVRALAHAPETDRLGRIVMVTSAVAGEGKSTVALSLARSAANAGQRSLLIDADLRNPSLHASLGVPVVPGLIELTLDGAAPRAIIRQLPGEHFNFIAAGRPPADALRPFTITGFKQLLLQMKDDYDVIVVDCPPVLFASETHLLLSSADMTLFLVRWRRTPRDVARKARLLLMRWSAGPCVTVLSQANMRRMRSGGRRLAEQYRYAYRYSRFSKGA